MKFLARLLFFAMLLAAIDVAAYLVLSSNLSDGIYPINGDSIGNPLAETWALTKAAAAGLLIIAAVTHNRWLRRIAAANIAGRCLLGVVFASLYVCAAAFFTLWGASWCYPHHYPIAAACWFAAIVMVVGGWQDMLQLGAASRSIAARRDSKD